MFRLTLAWLTLAALSVLLVFQVNLHSDLLFLDSVMTDLFEFGGHWQDWKLTPAPAYIPDMLLYAIGYFALPNPVLRIVFVSLGQALLLAWACSWLAATIKPTLSYSARIVIVLIVAIVVMVAAHSNMWLFFNSTNNHFAGLLFSLLGVGWILRYLEKPRVALALLIVMGGALAKASTSVFVINFTLPVLCVLVVAFVILRKDSRLRLRIAHVAALVVGSQLVAAGLDLLLIQHDALKGRAPLSAEAALASVRAFLEATRIAFTPDNRYTFALSLFILGCLIWVVFHWLLNLQVLRSHSSEPSRALALDISSNNWRHNLCVLFLLVVLPINVFGAIGSGGFADIYGYRYFAFPLCLGVLLWVLVLDSKAAFGQRLMTWGGFVGLMCLPLLGGLSVKPLFQASGRGNFSELVAKGNLRLPATGDAVGACLDRIATEGFALGSGVADFWYARGVIYKASRPLYILPALNNATPFFHMMTLGPLRDPKRYDLKPYNFVIMRQPGSSTQFELKPETMGRLLPSPAKIVRCERSDAEIWLYSETTLEKFVRGKIDHFLFLFGEGGGYVVSADQLPGKAGRVSGTGKIADEGADSPGFLSFGPYIDLPAGHYRLNIDYSSTGLTNKWDLGRFNDPDKLIVLASGELSASSQGRLNIKFEAKEPVQQFEVRTWFNGHGMLRLENIKIIREGAE